MLPFRVVVKPYLRPDLALAHPHPNSFSITLIQPLSFLTFTHSSAQRTTPIYFSFNHLHTLSTATEGGGGTPPPRTCQPSHVSTTYLLYFHILAHSFALFCTHKKHNPLVFNRFRTLRQKTRGGGYPVSCARPLRGDYHAPNKSPACPDLVGVTNHQSLLWPSAPLRRAAFGATIRKGTRNLYDPGKQLRSPRCLTILSGHRGPFDDVPGYTPTQSGSQVVPGSSVLTRVSGFVLTNPEQCGFQGLYLQTLSNLDRSRVARVTHPCRMVRGPASGKDAGKRRAGKAGSVRLG